MRRFRTYHEVEGRGAGDVPEQVDAQLQRLAHRLRDVRSIWLVASGKGGVGKSAVAANLAAALAVRGRAVGALDADLNGPSLARMLGADRSSLEVTDDGVVPALGVAGVRVMSMDLLLEADDAPLRWREPESAGFIWQSALETGTLREFLADVRWGALDTLILDLPPGTDKLARTFQLIPEPTGVLLVTTPSAAARSVVSRSVRLVRDTGVPLGLVANMTAYRCASCGHSEALFQHDGARKLADETGCNLWTDVPFDPMLAAETDAGRPLVLTGDSAAARALRDLASRVVAASPVAAASPTTDATGSTGRDPLAAAGGESP